MNMRFVMIMLCLLASPVWARPQLKIIPLQHRFAEELLPPLQALVGPGSSVNAYGNQLIVNAEPTELANIEETVRQLDVAKRNWRISVNNGGQEWQQKRSIGATGTVGNDDARVRIPDSHGHVANDVAITADDRSTESSQSGTMTLNALDGSPAFISVGQEIPYSGQWITLAKRYSRTVQPTGWHEVATGFVVRPRQIGDKVDVEITPRLAHPGSDGVIDFTSLSTHVQVRPGEWLDLGNLMGNRNEVTRAILGQGSEQGSSSMQLKIKVE